MSDTPQPVRILLVEDEEAHAALVRRAFRRQAPEAHLDVVSDLAGARWYLGSQTVDLVLSDLHLPDGKGTELLQSPGETELRPLVVMTSFGDENEAVRALKAGVLDYVVKSEYSLGDMPHIAARVLREIANGQEKKRIEDRLRILSHAMEQSSSSLLITDNKGNIEFANPKFTAVTGWTLEEIRGRNPRLLRGRNSSSIDYAALWNTILAGRTWRGVFLNKRRDGEEYWEENIISPIRDVSGNITHFLAVKEDITETLRAREELARLETQLRVAQKIQTIGTLAGGIAHDFNNILTPIFGFANMAVSSLPENHPARRDLAHVIKAAERARDLVRQILTFSRQGSSTREVIHLQPVVKEVMKLIRASLPATIHIHTDVSEDCPAALADASQIHQVLMNLCANAAHAMRDSGGILTVRMQTWRPKHEDLRTHPALGGSAIWLLLEVTDTGVGMTPEVQERVFEPFFTTKPVGEGTGLGLAVAHGIVAGHGGEIGVESKPGKGTTMRVWLPACEEHPQPKPEMPSASDLKRGHGERILVVDDESEITAMMGMVLGMLGYKVTESTSSQDAWSLFSANPGNFDLLITDQTMPTMTGLALAEKVLAIRPGFPILLISGYSETGEAMSYRELGIAEFLLKPVALSELAQAVRRVLGER